MTIEEKMEHFKNVSLDNASAKSNDILTAYKQSLDEQFEKHKETALLESKSVESAKLNAVRLEVKRELSKGNTIGLKNFQKFRLKFVELLHYTKTS